MKKFYKKVYSKKIKNSENSKNNKNSKKLLFILPYRKVPYYGFP